MPSFTIRNLSDELLDRIRTRAARERRSLNNEILVLIEQGMGGAPVAVPGGQVSAATQIGIWEMLAGRWSDTRTTEEVIRDVYASRTPGREVEAW